MRLRRILCIVSLLIVQLGICQNGSDSFPKRVNIDGVDAVAFTQEQAKKIQATKIDLEKSEEVIEGMKAQIELDVSVINSMHTLIKSYEEEREITSSIIENHRKKVLEYDKQIQSLESNLRRSRFSTKVLGGAAVVGIGILVGVLLGN